MVPQRKPHPGADQRRHGRRALPLLSPDFPLANLSASGRFRGHQGRGRRGTA